MAPPDIDTTVPDWFLPSVAALLAPRVSVTSLDVSPIPGGSNNRVFRVNAGSQSYFVKWYFTAPDDSRDRLRAEWQFSSFAWRHGLRSLPEPIANSPEHRIAIFEYLEGNRLRETEVNADHVNAALEFLLELNRHRDSPDAATLPNASESCFSIAEHLDCICRRVQKLQAATANGNVWHDARAFIHHSLANMTKQVIARIEKELANRQQSASRLLSPEERIISPSDFGFHNAVKDANVGLRFFDFEYSGWDDPAKLVCDFFCQIAVPAPQNLWREFIAKVEPIGGADLCWRSELLRPLYQLKWCCIVLNPLLQVGRERRQFSRGRDANITESECVARAERILAAIPQ